MELAIESLPYLWQGLLITLAVSVLTVVSSLIIGVLLGTLVVYGPLPVRWLILGYSDIIRGIPVLVLIFSVYYGLPPLGINLGNFPSAVVALTAFASAQVTARNARRVGSIRVTSSLGNVPGESAEGPSRGDTPPGRPRRPPSPRLAWLREFDRGGSCRSRR